MRGTADINRRLGAFIVEVPPDAACDSVQVSLGAVKLPMLLERLEADVGGGTCETTDFSRVVIDDNRGVG